MDGNSISSFTPILYQVRFLVFHNLFDVYRCVFSPVKGNVCTNGTQELRGTLRDTQCLETKSIHQGGESYPSE